MLKDIPGFDISIYYGHSMPMFIKGDSGLTTQIKHCCLLMGWKKMTFGQIC
jgi:hypothetical protein